MQESGDLHSPLNKRHVVARRSAKERYFRGAKADYYLSSDL